MINKDFNSYRVRTLFFNYLIIMFLLIGCKGPYQAMYQKNQLIIDGKSNDWKTILVSNKNGDFSYGITNDEENLYIQLNFNDQTIQQKVLLAGLTIWIDTTGNTSKELGIRCPVPRSQPKMDRNIKPDTDSPMHWDQNQIIEMELIGFNSPSEFYYCNEKPYCIEFSMSQDEFMSLSYELKIPFNSFHTSLANLQDSKICIGIETGTVKLQAHGPSGNMNEPQGRMNPSMSGNRPGEMSGGMPGGISGGMPGEMNGGMPSGNPNNNTMGDLSKSTKVWIKKIKLAQSDNLE